MPEEARDGGEGGEEEVVYDMKEPADERDDDDGVGDGDGAHEGDESESGSVRTESESDPA